VRVPRFVATRPDTGLLSLPWDLPLEEWPARELVTLPRGISRHVVRFVRVNGQVYAIKEVLEHLALHEYRLLRDLERLDTPSVEPVGVMTDRVTRDGEPIDSILVTRHLQFSLPYRALFSHTLRPDTVNRLIDALVALIVRLHLNGFFWGDCSLSNTLFRRDAGAFAAYLVDAETGELHDQISGGQRAHDLYTAEINLFGELLDLQEGGLLDQNVDPEETVAEITGRYEALWAELTGVEEFRADEMHRLDSRIRRLNDLGFDVAEIDIITDWDGSQVRIQPKVVDAGHHTRRLLRLTGLDVEENQARRLLNDLDSYAAATNQQGEDEEIVAHEWLTDIFEPVVRSVPPELRGKLEPAEVYHEVLEHRWFLSEQAGKEVGTMEAARAYVENVLGSKPDEKVALPTAVTLPGTTAVPTAAPEDDAPEPEVPEPEEPTPRTFPLDAATIKQSARTRNPPASD
jgi:tRNA A-37 threonylcarbamoyl transferase component Bud32